MQNLNCRQYLCTLIHAKAVPVVLTTINLQLDFKSLQDDKEISK